jgi:hypothetical protein
METQLNLVRIDPLTDHLHGYSDSQGTPDSIYIELDEDGILHAYAANRQDGVSSWLWHGRATRWGLSGNAYRMDTLNDLMYRLAPLCERLMELYRCEWDGSNLVGSWDSALDLAAGNVVADVESDLMVSEAEAWLTADGANSDKSLIVEALQEGFDILNNAEQVESYSNFLEELAETLDYCLYGDMSAALGNVIERYKEERGES